MIMSKGRVFKVFIAGLCIMVLISTGLYLSDKSTGKPNTQFIPSKTMLTIQMSDSERQKFFEKSKALLSEYYTSADDASRNGLPFALKVPSETVAKVQNIYVDRPGNPQDRRALILFDGGINGIQLTAVKESKQPDFEALVKSQIADMKAGILFNDMAPKVMDLDGTSAWTIEPGFNVIGEQKSPRPGVVEWWDNGVLYTIYGTRGPGGTKVSELLAIARSTKASTVDSNNHASAETLQALTPKPPAAISDQDDKKLGTIEFEE